MNEPDHPVLYSFRRCPYAMRARLALAISGIRCELREVKLSAKPDELVEISPKATVPVLVLPDGALVDESIDIMRWALSRHDPEGWLDGDDAALIATNDQGFKHDLDRYKYPQRYGSDPLVHRTNALDFLNELESRLSGTGQLSSGRTSITDAAIFPFVRQFAAVDREWFEATPFPRLKAWLEGHLSSALFKTIMIKVRPWTAGDPPIAFPPP